VTGSIHILKPHEVMAGRGLSLQVDCRRAGRVLSLEYQLSGPVADVLWPETVAPRRADGLWQATCFEVFATTTQGYVEYNLSPSGAWAAYRFDAYRQGGRALETPPPAAMMRHAPAMAALTADVTLPPDASGAIGLSAVIQTRDGVISYWALAHPSDKPDFHHPDSFVLTIPERS
jgi:hypothetical protein